MLPDDLLLVEVNTDRDSLQPTTSSRMMKK
jgi:hypothetical protein